MEHLGRGFNRLHHWRWRLKQSWQGCNILHCWRWRLDNRGHGSNVLHHWRLCRVHGRSRRDVLQQKALVPRTRQEKGAMYFSTGAGTTLHSLERARCTSPLALAQRTRLERARRTHPLALAPRTRQERARRTHPRVQPPRTRLELGRRAHPLALAPRILVALARRNSLLAEPLVLERCTPPLALVEASGIACSNDPSELDYTSRFVQRKTLSQNGHGVLNGKIILKE